MLPNSGMFACLLPRLFASLQVKTHVCSLEVSLACSLTSVDVNLQAFVCSCTFLWFSIFCLLSCVCVIASAVVLAASTKPCPVYASFELPLHFCLPGSNLTSIAICLFAFLPACFFHYIFTGLFPCVWFIYLRVCKHVRLH